MKQTGRRFDAAAFYGGTNSEAYRYLGAHRTRRSGKDATSSAPGRRTPRMCPLWAISAAGTLRPPDEKERGRLLGVFCAVPQALRYLQVRRDGTIGRNGPQGRPLRFHAETRPGTASKLYDLGGYRWGMTNGARAAQRHPSTARRSTFTRSISAHGGGTKTAILRLPHARARAGGSRSGPWLQLRRAHARHRVSA